MGELEDAYVSGWKARTLFVTAKTSGEERHLRRFVPRHRSVASDDLEHAPERELTAVSFSDRREVFGRLDQLGRKLALPGAILTMAGDAILLELLSPVVQHRATRPSLFGYGLP